jgi:hypothetical protein
MDTAVDLVEIDEVVLLLIVVLLDVADVPEVLGAVAAVLVVAVYGEGGGLVISSPINPCGDINWNPRLVALAE